MTLARRSAIPVTSEHADGGAAQLGRDRLGDEGSEETLREPHVQAPEKDAKGDARKSAFEGEREVCLEPPDDLVLLAPVESHGFEDDAFALRLGDVVLQHLEPADVVIGLRQDSDAVLQVDRLHPRQPSPDRDPPGGRLGRDLVCQKKPGDIGHGFTMNVTVVTKQAFSSSGARTIPPGDQCP